jgi:outer membrane autotransporter protein
MKELPDPEPCRLAARRMESRSSTRVLLAGASLAALSVLASLPAAAQQSLNPNQLSMGIAIRNTALPAAEDPALCPSLVRKSAQNDGLPADQQALLDRCGRVVREPDPTLKANALQEITAEELNAPATNAIDFGAAQRSNIAARLLTLRVAGTPLASLADPYSLYSTTGGASGDDLGGRLGLFINGSLGQGDKDQTAYEDAYDFDLTSVTVGVDYRFTDSLVGGVALGYSTSETDFDNSGSLDSDGISGSIFGSWYGEHAYADLIVGYGGQNLDSVRRVRYTLAEEPEPIDHTATGDTNSDLFSAGLSAGYQFGSGGWRFAPNAAVSYLKVSVDGFTEHGGSHPELNLDLGDQDAKSLQLQLGFDLGYTASTSWGVITPYARATQIWEQENDQQTFLLQYVTDPFKTAATTATVTSDKPDDSYLRWAIGVSAVFASGFAGFLDYASVASLDTVSYGEFTLGLRYAFP